MSSQRPNLRLFAERAISLGLTIIVALATFTLTRTASASAVMPCCADGSTHCNSAMMSNANAAPHESAEPMCGATIGVVSNEDTIVAEPDSRESQHVSTDKNSSRAITAPCPTECCSLAWSVSKRPKRDYADSTAPVRRPQPFDLRGAPRIPSITVGLSSRFDRTTPRGPPSS